MSNAGANEAMLGHFREHQAVVIGSLDLLLEPIERAGDALIEALSKGRKIIAFGNGGSAAQASHLAGELLGRYSFNRQPFPAVTLCCDPGVVTCIANDFGYSELFSRQVEALANSGDVVVAFTSSGKSDNVLRALKAARARAAFTIALTGAAGLSEANADIVVSVPSSATAHIQELHLIAVHIWCRFIDQAIGQRTDPAPIEETNHEQ
jgi:D-sedoheptulose 7-phosphate isomerase